MHKVASSGSRQNAAGTVAYVLKGFPRLSEMFIASEIYRLEQAGLPLKLYVIKPADEKTHHEVVDRIKAKPEYLPPTTSVSGTMLLCWLKQNLRPFLPSLGRILLRRPVGTMRAVLSALAQAIRARDSFWSAPRKIYLKEFLQASALADRLLECTDVRHLHAHFCHGAATVAWLASQITGVPFSFTAHAKDIYCEKLNPAGLLRRKMKAAAFVVTCTKANQQHMEQICNTKVHCIYHGLNPEFCWVLAEPAEETKRNGILRVLSVGRLVPKKGFDVLIDACVTLRNRAVPFSTVIIGEHGEHENDIRRRIAQHDLNSYVQLRGPITQRELFAEYRRSSVFCLPCRVLENGDRDGIPNVLVEAMASGLPIVSTTVSGIPEIVTNGVNGLLVPPDDAASLANALLSLRHDPLLARQLSSEASRTVSEKFDGEKFAAELENLFIETMK
jgi:glycosyltransferase involved in cell wall biosynthesis